MKRYSGKRTPDGAEVTVTDEKGARPLDPRFDLRNHSPTGFEWNFSGSGPSQLSLALLADALGDDRAEVNYQRFKQKVVARLEGDTWEMTQDDIRRAVEMIEADRGRGR